MTREWSKNSGWKGSVAEAFGQHGSDWRSAIAQIDGRDGVDFRRIIAERAGVSPVDWRQGVVILSGDSNWRRAMYTISDWINGNPVHIFGSNLVAWYSADIGVFSDAGVTPATNGQRVTRWNDQSGNGYHVSKLGLGPVFVADAVSGNPALLFTNPANNVLQTAVDAVALGADNVSTFGLARWGSNTQGFSRLFTFVATGQVDDWNSSDSAAFFILSNPGHDALMTTRNGDSYAIGADGSWPIDTWKRLGMSWSATGVTAYLDNVVSGSDIVSNTSFGVVGTLSVGDDKVNTAQSRWDGYVTDLVLVKGDITQSQRDAIDAYLVQKLS